MERFRRLWQRAATRTGAQKVLRRALLLAIVPNVLIAGTIAGVAPAQADSQSIIRSWSNGNCLDSNAAGAVYENPCWNPDDYQQWRQLGATTNPQGQVWTQLQDVATGLCLTHLPTGLLTQPCLSEATGGQAAYYQLWVNSPRIDQYNHLVWNFYNYGTGGYLDANSNGGGPYVNPTFVSPGPQDWTP